MVNLDDFSILPSAYSVFQNVCPMEPVTYLLIELCIRPMGIYLLNNNRCSFYFYILYLCKISLGLLKNIKYNILLSPVEPFFSLAAVPSRLASRFCWIAQNK